MSSSGNVLKTVFNFFGQGFNMLGNAFEMTSRQRKDTGLWRQFLPFARGIPGRPDDILGEQKCDGPIVPLWSIGRGRPLKRGGQITFGSLKDCVASAIEGKVLRDETLWKS